MGHSTMQLFLVLVLVSTVLVQASKLPNYITACSVKDPELNECMMRQAKIFIPEIAQGLKEFGLPSLDPLPVSLMQLEQRKAGSIEVSFNLTDTKHYGFKDLSVQSVKADPKNHHYEFNFFLPRFSVIGNYKIKGRILVLPISGSGYTNFTTVNQNITVVLDCKLEQRKGETYLKITKVKNWFVYDKIYIRMDNLFGNKQLSDTMNVLLNQNGKEAFKDLKPEAENLYNEIFSSLIGRIFSKIPYNQLFKVD